MYRSILNEYPYIAAHLSTHHSQTLSKFGFGNIQHKHDRPYDDPSLALPARQTRHTQETPPGGAQTRHILVSA